MACYRTWALPLVLATLPISAEGIQEGQLQGRCSVSGKVLQAETVQPAGRVLVKLEDSGGGAVARQSLTDELGNFEFLDLPCATYVVQASDSEHEAAPIWVEFSFGNFASVTPLLQRKAEQDRRPSGEVVSLRELELPGEARKAFAEGLRELNRRKRLDRSITHFRKAIELYQGFDEAYIQLSRAHLAQGQVSEAKQVLQKAVAISPKNARAYLLLGLVYKEQGEIEMSVGTLQQAINADANTWLAHLELGKIFLMKRELEQARVHAERVHQLNPQAPSAHFLLYNLYILRQDYRAALVEVDELLQMQPRGNWAPQLRERRKILRESLGLPP